MRTPAVEKLGYYPTNEPIVELINTYIKPCEEGKARLFDPCAGEGLAAEMVGKHINAETWGVELSYSRAALATKRLDKVLEDSYFATYMTDEVVSVLYLNPPYDYNHNTKNRYEQEFLQRATASLMRGGLLVYIVPQQTLMIPRVTKILDGYYENIRVVRFTDDIFPIYKQVILFATRRQQWVAPSEETMKLIRDLGNPAVDLPIIEAQSEPIYQALPGPVKTKAGGQVRFYRTRIGDIEMLELSDQQGYLGSAEWEDLIYPDRVDSSQLTPAMPLKKGHIAFLMASGLMDIVRLTNENGDPILVKGRAVKEKCLIKTVVSGEDEKEIWRDKIKTTICKLDPSIQDQGIIQNIEDVEALTKFMDDYSEKLAIHIQQHYKPRYNFDPTPQETRKLDSLALGMPVLQGQEKPGLLPAQRHAVTAAYRAIKELGVASFQAEMGTGKTTMAASVAYMVNKFPIVIICPPHLIEKWAREIGQTIPGAKAREIRRIGRTKVNNKTTDVNDVEKFLEDAENGLLGPYPVAIISNSMVGRQAGWAPAVIENKKKQMVYCPQCGKAIEVTPMRGEAYYPRNANEMPKNPIYCNNIVKGVTRDQHGHAIHDASGQPIWGKTLCGNLLYKKREEDRSVSISEYILKHCRGRFKMVIADEVHQYKSSGADRAYAFQHLARSCDYVLTLTGTMFGGMSSSIFWLLHRINHGVRSDFTFKDEKRWVHLYGIEETERRTHGTDNSEDDYGYGGNRRYKNNAPKEKPGISPVIITRFLDSTIFMGIKDLGLDLPEYKEDLITIPMKANHAMQVAQVTNKLYDMMMKNPKYLSSWLQWGLARPNSAFRDEKVMIKVADKKAETYGERWDLVQRKKEEDEVVLAELMDLPAIVKGDDQLPKEEWLVQFCLAEKSQGRKNLIYIRQTGTRDIQYRITDILNKAHIRAQELPASLEPKKREAWINANSDRLDALIVNPRKVETGLDLVMFSNVIFFEIEYSLYTVWQAVRRVWRLGQRQPVKAVFSAYADTMEENALVLVGSKMKAAQLIYGDEVGGAIVDDSGDDDDFATMLAKQVRSNTKLKDLRSMFADTATYSHNPIGNMIKPSALILPVKSVKTPEETSWLEWAKQNGIGPINKPQRKPKIDDSKQGSLF